MWQPIETAPKDGTSILGYYLNEMAVIRWQKGWNEWHYAQPRGSNWWPTHWMPLPPPPAAQP
jgi:hypothetical protein